MPWLRREKFSIFHCCSASAFVRALLLCSAILSGANSQAGEPGGLFVTHNAARSASLYVSTASAGAVLFPGLTNLSGIVDISLGFIAGDWIGGYDAPTTTFELTLNDTFASFVLVFFDSTHTKATLVELRSVNNSVVARQRSARYAAGDKRQNFSYSALSSTATMGARGYGVKSFSLMKAASPTPPPTSLAAGTVLLEHNSAFDMRLFVPTLAETPQTLPGLRDLTGASLIRAVLCGDGVVRCVYGQITERITTATGLQFVVGARDSQYDRRALIRLDVTLSATVVAAQVGARQGLVSETLPSALYASLSTNGTAGAAGIGILSFALTLSVSATAAPTARPTPAPTPPPTPRPLPTTRHRWRRRLHRKSHRLHRKRPPLQPRRLSRRRQLLLLCRRQHSLLLLCRRRRW